MSVIHRVFDRAIRRHVAMKVLSPECSARDAGLFVEEARITGQLDHPNIVPVYSIACDGEGRCDRFMMKMVEGRTLRDIFSGYEGETLTGRKLEELLRVLLKVCDAVSFAHSRGVVHCDLKPSNIMVGTHGQVYVMDWGVALSSPGGPAAGDMHTGTARSSSAGRSAVSGKAIGTPAYMSPEQAKGRTHQIDERTDVFGLGGMLYHLLTYRPPYQGRGVRRLLQLAQAGNVVPPQKLVSPRPLSPRLCEIAMKALAPDPDDRHQSVDDFKEAVEDFLRVGGWFASRHFRRNTVIIREGEIGDAAYIIRSGRCIIYRMSGRTRTVLRTVGPGDVFGETAIFANSPRTANVRAATDVLAWVVTREVLEQELGASPWLAALVRAVAERFVEMDDAMRRGQSGKVR